MSKEVRVFAPATVANVSCGFDVFGFALETPGDELCVRLSDKPGVRIVEVTGDHGALSWDPAKNTASLAVIKLLEQMKTSQGVEIKLHKNMPLGSGLGSSAASAAGSLFAVNHLLGNPFSAKDLLPFALESERMACGSGHADNAAPALLGGFVIVRGYHPLDVIKIPVAMKLFCSILHPHVEVKTEEARKLLGKEISLQQHVEQTGNAAGLVAGLMLGDEALVGKCLNDVIAEPVRAGLIPGFSQIVEAARNAGALGAGISGSGPSVFALSQTLQAAEKIGESMFRACPSKSSLYISQLNEQGPLILS